MQCVATHLIPAEEGDPKDVLGYVVVVLMDNKGHVTILTRAINRPSNYGKPPRSRLLAEDPCAE